MGKNDKNGTIEVVLCNRHNGTKVPGKTPYKTFGGIGRGGGEWLSRQLARHMTKGLARVKQGDREDQFFGEGHYAERPQ